MRKKLQQDLIFISNKNYYILPPLPLLRDDSSKLVVSLWTDPSTNQNMSSPMTQPIGWPQNRLRHDVGAGGRHHGANRTHSNAYEAHPTWSSFQNLRHALGRRIEVGHFFHVFFFFFFFIFSYHLIWSTIYCMMLRCMNYFDDFFSMFFLDVCTIFGHVGC